MPIGKTTNPKDNVYHFSHRNQEDILCPQSKKILLEDSFHPAKVDLYCLDPTKAFPTLLGPERTTSHINRVP